MKKYIIAAAFLSAIGMHAQEFGTMDALNYSTEQLNGTARFKAMGGAFGALGGDLSGVMINPAGSAVFANSVAGATMTSFNSNTNTNYFGTSDKTNFNSFDLNQAGGSWIFKNNNDQSGWKKLAFSVNYENTNNFDNSSFAYGMNPTNSISNYFLQYANGGAYQLGDLRTLPGESIDDLYAYLGNTPGLGFGAQQAFLGFQSYILNPVEDVDTNTMYVSNIPAGGDYYHEFEKHTRGYYSKLALNFGAQYGEKWSFGATVNIHVADFYQWSSLYEDNINNPENGVQALRFTNEYTTTGSGFSLQAGTIYKITESFRAGLAYQSPQWMWLNDKLTQNIWTDRTENSTDLLFTMVDPQIVNVYDNYRLKSPGKWTGSLAYIFGSHGLISADYSLKDYGNSKYSGDSQFGFVNSGISNDLTVAGDLRVGTEWRFGIISVRGGYRNEASPYKNGRTMGDLNGFSGGLGFAFGRTKFDLAYNYWQRDYQQQFFQTGLTDAAETTVKNHNVSLSVMFDL